MANGVNVASEAIKAELRKDILNTPTDEVKVSDIIKLFTTSAKLSIDENGKRTFLTSKPKYDTKMVVHLKANEYINTTDITTTIGKILFNKLLIENKLNTIIPGGFYNKTFTKKAWREIASLSANAIMENKLTTEQWASYLKSFELYGLKLTTSFSPSFTPNVIKPIPEVQKQKKELLAELAKNPNPQLADYVNIENQLVATAKKAIGNDPGMSLYDSGSRGSFDNDYKINTIIVGPVKNTATGGYDFMTSDMIEGLKKEDIPKAGNMVVAASHPKAVGTAVGGYMTKQFYAAFQSTTLGDIEDCGSVFTIPKLLSSDKIINSYMYQYMVLPNGKLECLIPDNVDKYRNKLVRFRTPMGCLSEKYCHICTGDRFNRLDIQNIGLTTGKVSNNLMQKQMKKFHEIKINLAKVDPDSLLIG